jgi:hypothetical protein
MDEKKSKPLTPKEGGQSKEGRGRLGEFKSRLRWTVEEDGGGEELLPIRKRRQLTFT